MDGNNYQKEAARTLINAPDFQISNEQLFLIHNALVVSRHAAALTEYLKKGIFHQQGYMDDAIKQRAISIRQASFALENLERFQPLLPYSFSDNEIMLVWNATGLAGEAGEVLEHILSATYDGRNDGKGVDSELLEKELGDLLWYVAGLCTKAGLSLDTVMAKNIEKLKTRFPDGWSPEDAAKRVYVQEAASTTMTIDEFIASADLMELASQLDKRQIDGLHEGVGWWQVDAVVWAARALADRIETGKSPYTEEAYLEEIQRQLLAVTGIISHLRNVPKDEVRTLMYHKLDTFYQAADLMLAMFLDIQNELLPLVRENRRTMPDDLPEHEQHNKEK
jgi:NTP pyrophosphatase (non-canonical NTP hydrolase)